MEICNENIAFLMRGKRPASRLEEEFFSMKTLCSTPPAECERARQPVLPAAERRRL